MNEYDQKFIFEWKSGNLKFYYQQSNGFVLEKKFDFPNKESPPELDFKQSEKFVVLNSNDYTKPTVQVQLPEKLPQVVRLSVKENQTENYSLKSPTPQLALVVSPPASEQTNNSFEVVKTPEGKGDLVVDVNKDDKEVLKNSGIDVSATLKSAMGVLNLYPEKISVFSNTNQIPQIIKMELVDNTVKITNISENISNDLKLFTLETAENEKNVIVGLSEETIEKFKLKGIQDPLVELKKYMEKNNSTVVVQ